MSNAPGNPEKPDIQIDAIATVSRQGSRNLAVNKTKAVEAANSPVAEQLGGDDLGDSAQDIPQPTVRGWIRRLGVDQLKRFS